MAWDCDELPAPSDAPPTWMDVERCNRVPAATPTIAALALASYPEPCMGSAQFRELRDAGIIPSIRKPYIPPVSADLLAEIRDLRARVQELERRAMPSIIVAPTPLQVRQVEASRNTPEDEDLFIPGVCRFVARAPLRSLPYGVAVVADASVPPDEVQIRGLTFVRRIVNLTLPAEP